MRISDWSSDVCSSDLFFDVLRPAAFFFGRRAVALQMCSIPAVAGHVRGRMRTAACQHHATDKAALERIATHVGFIGAGDLLDQLLAADIAAVSRAREQFVEKWIGAVQARVDRKSTRLNSSH